MKPNPCCLPSDTLVLFFNYCNKGGSSLSNFICRCDQQMALQEAAEEDPQRSAQGGLRGSLASEQNPVHRAEVGHFILLAVLWSPTFFAGAG